MPRLAKCAAKDSDQLMPEQYADSDSRATSRARCESESCSSAAGTVPGVSSAKNAEKKDKEKEPVSEFLRHLILEWESAGKKLYVLAREAGLAKSMPSQIKGNTSDAGFYSAAKLAPVFGYRDLPDLVSAAYVWWRSKDKTQTPPSSAESPVAAAVRAALEFAVTQEQIDRAFQRYPPEEFAQMAPGWWLSKLLEEQHLDALRASERKGEARADASAKRVRGSKQAQLRAVSVQVAARKTDATARSAAAKKKADQARADASTKAPRHRDRAG